MLKNQHTVIDVVAGPGENNPVAIVFADISGSTLLYETLGNKLALKRVEECLSLLARVTERHGGQVIKTMGDEIMAVFADAAAAVTAACAMQTETSQQAASGRNPLRIRLGLHFGEVIREGGDVFGDAVNVAARMASLAKANQIITTRQTVNLLPSHLRADTRSLGRASVKGKREGIEICEVLWQGEGDLTLILSTDVPLGAHSARLSLRHGNAELVLDLAHPTAILGRDEQVDITVSDRRASRQHARIELRGGKFVLTDQSSNGTYVTTGDGKKVFLHREELVLIEAGVISLGGDADKASADVIHYVLAP